LDILISGACSAFSYDSSNVAIDMNLLLGEEGLGISSIADAFLGYDVPQIVMYKIVPPDMDWGNAPDSDAISCTYGSSTSIYLIVSSLVVFPDRAKDPVDLEELLGTIYSEAWGIRRSEQLRRSSAVTALPGTEITDNLCPHITFIEGYADSFCTEGFAFDMTYTLYVLNELGHGVPLTPGVSTEKDTYLFLKIAYDNYSDYQEPEYLCPCLNNDSCFVACTNIIIRSGKFTTEGINSFMGSADLNQVSQHYRAEAFRCDAVIGDIDINLPIVNRMDMLFAYAVPTRVDIVQDSNINSYIAHVAVFQGQFDCGTISMRPVPEPTPILLLALGAVFIRRGTK
jgi:hypothetical protein